MHVRDVRTFAHADEMLDDLLECCQKGGRVSTSCPILAAEAHRKAKALKATLEKLKRALQGTGEASLLKPKKKPLYQRISEDRVVQEIARLVGHFGIHEKELGTLLRQLAQKDNWDRIIEVKNELTSLDVETCWVALRPEVLRACRPVIGPSPGDDDYEVWWAGKGGPPRPRSPNDPPAPKEEPATGEPAPEGYPPKGGEADEGACQTIP